MATQTIAPRGGLGPAWSGRDNNYQPPTALFRDIFIHEIRTPLTVARIALDLLRNAPDAAEVGRLAGWVEQSLEWLQRLAESVPAWTALISGEVVLNRRLITVKEWVEPALALIQPLLAWKEQQLRFIGAVPAAPVWGDPCWLQQAVVNLLTNAVRYGPRGDTIEVVVDSGRTRVEVRVTDHGPGLTPREIQWLFRPYGRTRPDADGWGLGLFLVRRVVELHSGTVGVSSRPGKVTTFRITLPAAGYEPENGGTPRRVNHRRP